MTTTTNTNGICFDVSDWEAHGWKWGKMTQAGAAQAEKVGRDRFQGFDRFAADVFHRFVAETPAPVAAPEGADVFARLHGEMDKIPEVEDLRARCAGDDQYASIATAATLSSLVDAVPAQDGGQVATGEDERAAAEYLRSLLEGEDLDAEAVADAARSLAEMQAAAAAAQDRAAQAAADLDGTDVRAAMRRAAKAAKEAIDQQEQMVDGFLAGQGAHSGRGERREVAKALAQYAGKAEALKRIAEIAGRLRRIAVQKQSEKARRGTDEIAGVEQGRDLERTIAAEWAIADDEDLADLFALRYTEGALVQLDIRSKDEDGRGPIVVCLDSSGSMGGAPAAWAAGVAMAFVEIAARQRRSVALLHFGARVLRTDIFPAKQRIAPAELIDAVTFFAADGGTDFEAPLSEAVRLIRSDANTKAADVVFVTDGQASLSQTWLDGFRRDRAELGFNVYSVLIGTEAEALKAVSSEIVSLADVAEDEAMHGLFGRV